MSRDKELADKILDSINVLIALDKKRVVTHNKKNLYPSEVQILMELCIIEDKELKIVEDTNVTEIAKQMGLTKGAVSQTLSRLQKKGIITKKIQPKNNNKLKIGFTKSGTQLMLLLDNTKKSIEGKYLRYLKKLSEKEKDTISDFLDKMIRIMEKI